MSEIIIPPDYPPPAGEIFIEEPIPTTPPAFAGPFGFWQWPLLNRLRNFMNRERRPLQRLRGAGPRAKVTEIARTPDGYSIIEYER